MAAALFRGGATTQETVLGMEESHHLKWKVLMVDTD